jgi:hypothetical protein
MRPILFVALMIGVASPLTSIDANGQTVCLTPASDSRSVIPRPDRTLLAPPLKLDCAFNATVDDASGQPQTDATRGQADSSAEATLRAKLDYELQCHRHVEMILRDRLAQLQAAARETVNSVNRRGQSAASCGIAGAKPGSAALVPLPDQALLTPPAEFNCEFKPAGADDARAAEVKLDYELQCYRHAELIVRDRLERLQASIGDTINVVGGREQRAVKPSPPQPPQPQQARQPEQAGKPDQVSQPRPVGHDLARALQSGGFVIVHRYTEGTPGSTPPAAAATIDSPLRVSPRGQADARAMGQVYRRLKIPVAQVLSSEHYVVYQTATAAFGDGVKLNRDLTGSRSFTDPAELERSLAGLRSRVATRPPSGTNVVLWTHEGKFKKAFGRSLAPGETVVFGPGNGRVPHEVARLSLQQFLALAQRTNGE